MKEVIMWTGVIAVAILMMIVPMLTVASFLLNWFSSVKFLLTVISILEFGSLIIGIGSNIEL